MIIILCTTNNLDNAKNIAGALVNEHLCACVNILPKISSVYKWEGKIVNDDEYLLIIKTKDDLFDKIESRIKELHPYKVPEIISINVSNASKDYINWVNSI